MVEIRPFGRLHTGFIMHIYVYLQYCKRSGQNLQKEHLAKSVSVLLHALVQSDILDEDLETYVHAACTQIFEGTSYTVPKSRL